MPRFLAIGHVTRDQRPGGDVLGGTVAYAAIAAQRLGWEAAILTAAGPDFDPARELPGIASFVAPSRATTRFVNRLRRSRWPLAERGRARRRHRSRAAARCVAQPRRAAARPASRRGGGRDGRSLRGRGRGRHRTGLAARDRPGRRRLATRVGRARPGSRLGPRAVLVRERPARRLGWRHVAAGTRSDRRADARLAGSHAVHARRGAGRGRAAPRGGGCNGRGRRLRGRVSGALP